MRFTVVWMGLGAAAATLSMAAAAADPMLESSFAPPCSELVLTETGVRLEITTGAERHSWWSSAEDDAPASSGATVPSAGPCDLGRPAEPPPGATVRVGVAVGTPLRVIGHNVELIIAPLSRMVSGNPASSGESTSNPAVTLDLTGGSAVLEGPATWNLMLSEVHLDARGLDGPVTVTQQSGTSHISDGDGNLTITSAEGDVYVAGHSGSIHVDQRGGRFESFEGNGPLSLTVDAGVFALRECDGAAAKLSLTGADGVLEGPSFRQIVVTADRSTLEAFGADESTPLSLEFAGGSLDLREWNGRVTVAGSASQIRIDRLVGNLDAVIRNESTLNAADVAGIVNLQSRDSSVRQLRAKVLNATLEQSSLTAEVTDRVAALHARTSSVYLDLTGTSSRSMLQVTEGSVVEIDAGQPCRVDIRGLEQLDPVHVSGCETRSPGVPWGRRGRGGVDGGTPSLIVLDMSPDSRALVNGRSR